MTEPEQSTAAEQKIDAAVGVAIAAAPPVVREWAKKNNLAGWIYSTITTIGLIWTFAGPPIKHKAQSVVAPMVEIAYREQDAKKAAELAVWTNLIGELAETLRADHPVTMENARAGLARDSSRSNLYMRVGDLEKSVETIKQEGRHAP